MRCLRFIVLVSSLTAYAHDADVIYVLAETRDAQIEETVTLTAGSLAQLAPIDADGDGNLTQADLDARADALHAGVWEQMPLTAQAAPCVRSDERAKVREGFVELSAKFTCGEGELRQDFRILSVLPTNYRVVLGSQLDGEKNRTFAQGTFTALTIARAEGLSAFTIRSRIADGFALCFTGHIAALVFLLFFTAKARAAVLLVFTTLGGAFLQLPAITSPIALGVSAIGLVLLRKHPRVGLFAAAVGLGIGALNQGQDMLALSLGTLLGLTLLGVPAVLIGRLLQRRPLTLITTQVVLAAAVCVSILSRLA